MDPIPAAFEPLGSLQLEIMHLFWAFPPGSTATVADIMEALNGTQPRPLAYTTYLTVMRNLARRRVLKQEKIAARAHQFSPPITKREYELSMLRNMRDTFYRGSGADMHIHVTAFCGDRHA